MKFLLDENVPRRLTRTIVACGHEVVHVEPGSTDAEVFARASADKLILITHDTDFLDTSAFAVLDTPGRIVIRVFPTVFALHQERLEACLALLPELEVMGKLVVISSESISVRE